MYFFKLSRQSYVAHIAWQLQYPPQRFRNNARRRSNGNSSRLREMGGRAMHRVWYVCELGSTLLSHRRSWRRNEKLSDCFIVSTGPTSKTVGQGLQPRVAAKQGCICQPLSEITSPTRGGSTGRELQKPDLFEERREEGREKGARPRLALFAALPVIKY